MEYKNPGKDAGAGGREGYSTEFRVGVCKEPMQIHIHITSVIHTPHPYNGLLIAPQSPTFISNYLGNIDISITKDTGRIPFGVRITTFRYTLLRS